jgi:uncharacterized membrane protein
MTIDWIALGSLATGFVVGYLVWFFVTRFAEYTLQALVGVIAVMFAGVMITFLTNNLSVNATGFGQYAVGLFIGFVAYAVLKKLSTGTWPTLEPPS